MLPLLYMPCIATNACPPLKHPVTCAHSTVVNCTERNPSHYSNGKNDFWRECNFFTLATTFTSADYVHHGNYGWEREGRGVVIPCACRNRYVETNARVRSGPFFFFLLFDGYMHTHRCGFHTGQRATKKQSLSSVDKEYAFTHMMTVKVDGVSQDAMARAAETIEDEITAYFLPAPVDGDADGGGSGDGGGAARRESTTSPHVWAVVTKVIAAAAREARAAGVTDTFANTEFKLLPVRFCQTFSHALTPNVEVHASFASACSSPCTVTDCPSLPPSLPPCLSTRRVRLYFVWKRRLLT